MKSERFETLRPLARSLTADALSLKPAAKRIGVESWFPYYAGYSSEFVRRSLGALGAAPGWAVLDPWNGSGTTTAVADHLGCDALGYDLNPVAALVAAARLTRGEDAAHSSGLAAELLSVASRGDRDVRTNEPLSAWLTPRVVRRYRAIEAAVMALLGSKAGVRVDLSTSTPPPFAAFFLLCLIRAAKGLARIKENSNPTWVTPERRGDAQAGTLDRAFLAMVDACARDAEMAGSTRSSLRTTSAIALADARALPVADSTVDAVITSPPYCTRIDYFHATMFELAALGIGPDDTRFRVLRASAMGTNLVRAGSRPDTSVQPAAVRRLLETISNHPSKASDTYYVGNFAQYFDDARLSIMEIRRVLKPGATAVLVVQTSYYKEIPVALGALYAALGEKVGLRAHVVLQIPVRRVLASINPRATHHTSDRHYTEDVVALQRVA
jgi:DNA modification methylase